MKKHGSLITETRPYFKHTTGTFMFAFCIGTHQCLLAKIECPLADYFCRAWMLSTYLVKTMKFNFFFVLLKKGKPYFCLISLSTWNSIRHFTHRNTTIVQRLQKDVKKNIFLQATSRVRKAVSIHLYTHTPKDVYIHQDSVL